MSGVELNLGQDLCDCCVELNLEPPAAAAVDGLTYGPGVFRSGQIDDYLRLKTDQAAGAGGNSTPDIGNGSAILIPSSGTYTLRAFIGEQSVGTEYTISLYRACISNFSSSTLVSTIARSDAVASSPGTASVVNDVVMFTWPATAYIAQDVVIFRLQRTNLVTPSANWGVFLVLGGATL